MNALQEEPCLGLVPGEVGAQDLTSAHGCDGCDIRIKETRCLHIPNQDSHLLGSEKLSDMWNEKRQTGPVILHKYKVASTSSDHLRPSISRWRLPKLAFT